ncbi:MAG: hypothetical protein WCK70_10530 [Chloroflexales bacterium]
MLRQLTVRLAQDLEGASNVDQLRELDWYGEPQNPIPIYFSLAGYSHRIRGDIKKCLCDQFRNSGRFDDFDVEKFTKLLLHRRLRFAIFLDSFEEMLRDNESGSLVALQSFCAEFSYRATIFIGCRSQLVSRVPGADQHDNIAILPIHERFIYEYLENLSFSSTNVVAEMIHLFQSKIGNDIYQLFARPRMIEALKSYLQNLATAQIQAQVEIEKQECRDEAKIETQDVHVNIILSHILEQTIEYFLRTEIRKRPPEGIENTDMLLEEIRQKLEHIAFQICTNNKNPYIDFQRTYGEAFIAWCIDADIIKIDRRVVKFTSLLMRDYLAAAWIFYQDLGETVALLPVRVSQFIAEISATDC